MEKIVFTSEDTGEDVEFFVLEQTKISGNSYILVTDSLTDDAQCLILKDTSDEESSDSVYEIVEDEEELDAIAKVFDELMDEVDIER